MFIVKETDTIRIHARFAPNPAQKRVLLSFTGIGHRIGNMDAQQPEFFTAGNSFDNILFIADLTRSWGNAFDLGQELAELAPYLEGREVFTLGNSLGGFLAILTARHVPVTACAAIVPQFSVSPKLVPGEKRWIRYTQNISEWRETSLAGQFRARTRYTILSASAEIERKQWRRFPVRRFISHYLVTPSAHNLAQHLKDQDLLQELLTEIWKGRFTAAWLAERAGKTVHALSGPEHVPGTPVPGSDRRRPPRKRPQKVAGPSNS